MKNKAPRLALADLPLRADLQGKNPYGAPQITVAHPMNTNENPFAPSAKLQHALIETARTVAGNFNRYPDRDALQLRQALASYINNTVMGDYPITAKNIWAANGSNEILQQILQAFAGHGTYALGSQNSYSMHSIITEGTHTRWHQTPHLSDFTIDCDAMIRDIDLYRPHIVFITRPNNPTGISEPLDKIIRILDAAPGMVVIDEAYAEFSTSPSVLELFEQYSHKMIVTRTMSKAFAYAGGRLGYLIAQEAVIDALLLVRLPYHLSSMTQALACTAIDFAHETLASVHTVIEYRENMRKQLQDMGYTVVPSDANFLLFGNFSHPEKAWNEYLHQGILLRDLHIPQKLRVSIGTAEDNAAFIECSTQLAQYALEK